MTKSKLIQPGSTQGTTGTFRNGCTTGSCGIESIGSEMGSSCSATETDPVFLASPAATISQEDISRWNGLNSHREWGEKITGVHPGTLWDESLTDDYRYICVRTGDASLTIAGAIWKKILLYENTI